MARSASVAHVLTANAVIIVLAGCSTAVSKVATLPAGGSMSIQTRSVRAESANVHSAKIGSNEPLVYVADFDDGDVVVFDRDGVQRRKIRTAGGPIGLFVDPSKNLWIAVEKRVEVYTKGGASRIKTLSDRYGYPNDLTMCPDGTVYVANESGPNNTPGSISVYANGSTKPTGQLVDPNEAYTWYVTCDGRGNVYSTVQTPDYRERVDVYLGGKQTGLKNSGIIVRNAGGMKAYNSSTDQSSIFIIDDHNNIVTDWNCSRIPCLATRQMHADYNSGVVALDIARHGKVVLTVESYNSQAVAFAFPGGEVRRTYPVYSSISLVSGGAFDPGQSL